MDQNRLCAGRLPDESDRAAIREARAVILPQGCRRELFDMARENCSHLFPDYTARFTYPGKTGQIELFRKVGAAHPDTDVYRNVAAFYGKNGTGFENFRFSFPAVLKLDWGGEGEGVWRIDAAEDLAAVLKKVAAFEKTGQSGFLVQQYIPHAGRSLRVVVIGRTVKSYWRVQPDPEIFGGSVSAGARIDHQTDPELQQAAKDAAADFCLRTGINLAGMDFLFPEASVTGANGPPLFLEVNYFFGRRGLGGSDGYYPLLEGAVADWLQSLHLQPTCADTAAHSC